MEAMGCGCAVASTRYGTEDILTDGVSGRVINVFDMDGAVKVLSEMVANPAGLLPFVREGKRVAANLLWDRQTDMLESILKSVKPYDPVDVDQIRRGNDDEMHKAYG
jgi:glycosyltransferase involved in cell wall biosynthesis